MDTAKRPETVFAKKFEKAFIAGERSDIAMHKALIVGLVDFIKSDNNTTGIAWAVRFMQARNPESARFNAVVKFLTSVAKLRVIIDEDPAKTNVKTVKKHVYDVAWLDGCKATPWYEVARKMQVVKPWESRVDNDVKFYATGYIMGEVTRDQLLEVYAPKMVDQIIRTALSDTKLQKRAAERMTKLAEQEAA